MSEITNTLNTLLKTKASEWNIEHDIPTIVASLRTQRERWNAEQAKGSRQIVKSKNIPTGPPLILGPAKTASITDALKDVKV